MSDFIEDGHVWMPPGGSSAPTNIQATYSRLMRAVRELAAASKAHDDEIRKMVEQRTKGEQ